MGDRLGILGVVGLTFQYIFFLAFMLFCEEKMRQPGIEPGSTAWKAAMLTTIPLTLVMSKILILGCRT